MADININSGPSASVVAVAGVASMYATLIAPYTSTGPVSGVDAADSTPKDPAAGFLSTRNILKIERGQGTHAVLQLLYPASATLTTALVVNVFGRASDLGTWEACRNRAGSIDITITPDTTNDVKETIAGVSYRKTTVDIENHVVDLLGNQQFTASVVTALNLDSTNEQSAFLRAKVI